MDVRTEANAYDESNPYVTGCDEFEFFQRLDDSAQYSTLFRNDRPAGTLQRRRAYDKGPVWTLYALDGTKLREWFFAPKYAVLARGSVRILTKQMSEVR
jgi:hypothetical protein